MDVQFVDRILICSDCHGEFIFTAGEQLFFHDKQFKNDPKRCKPCKSRRSGLSAAANGTGPAPAGLSRTETRTECSECGVQTTVPFKPTQGRPVLCRQCFQARNKAAAPPVAVPTPVPIGAPVPAASSVPPGAQTSAPSSVQTSVPPGVQTTAQTISALTAASTEANGTALSADAATLAAASMASASPQSSVASAADLASIATLETKPAAAPVAQIPPELLAAALAEGPRPDQLAVAVSKSQEA